QSQRVNGRPILGMLIMHKEHILPADFIHGHQIANCLFERAEGLVVIEIADVLADESLPLDNERHGVLEVGSNGKNWPIRGRLDREAGDGPRRAPARAAEKGRPKSSNASDRVVDASR